LSAVIQYNNVEVLKQDLADLPEKMLDWAEEVLLDRAYLMLGIAQLNVRVDTGSLRDSGRIERGGMGKHWRRIRVRFGGYVTNPKTGRLVDYAVIVERKYPFLRPAYEEIKGDVGFLIAQKVVENAQQ